MNIRIRYTFVFACLATTLFSCYTSKNNTLNPENTPDKNIVKTDCFVEFNNGEIKKFSSIKLVTGVFVSPYLLADGELKILSAQIKAYKDEKFYAIAQREFYTQGKGHISTHVLPGFAIREIKGNLNLYSLQFYNLGTVHKKFFLQNGNDGKIVPYSAEILSEYFKDNKEISNYMSKRKKKINSKELLSLVENYNNSASISKN